MNNINDKTKRRLIVASGLIISVIFIVLITNQLKKEPIEDAVLPDQSIEANDVVMSFLRCRLFYSISPECGRCCGPLYCHFERFTEN